MTKETLSASTRTKKMEVTCKRGKEIKVAKEYTRAEILVIFVEADLTKRQYAVIQSANKVIYPGYCRQKEAKKVCYPPKHHIIII